MSRVNHSVVSGWDVVSDAYQERYAIPSDRLHLGPMVPGPDELGLDLDPRGLVVLDLGCGGGQNAVACVRAGAQRVIAVDPSRRQLEHALRLAERDGADVEFRLLTEDTLLALSGIDLVVSVYALQFVADLDATLVEVAALLAPGGRLVLSVDHPLRIAGEWDDDEFRVHDYLRQGWQSWTYAFPEAGVEAPMMRFRRPTEAWVRAVLGAGLRLVDLREPGPSATDDRFGARSRHGLGDPRNVFDRRRLARVPGSLLIVAGKDA